MGSTIPELLALAQRMTALDALDKALGKATAAEIRFPDGDVNRIGRARVVALTFGTDAEARAFATAAEAATKG